MNVEKIKALAELLRSDRAANHFSMRDYITFDLDFLTGQEPVGEILHTCGTAACIAGWAVAMERPAVPFAYPTTGYSDMAAEILDISQYEADNLFAPLNVFWDEVTPEIAAGVLDTLADCGRVIWPDEVLHSWRKKS